MNTLTQRLNVIAKALPTWLTAAAAALTGLALGLTGVIDALAPFEDHPVVGYVIGALTAVVATLTSIVVVIRNVTPVAKSERGLLPKGDQ